MYGLYLRSGLIYKESVAESKKSFSIQYFFVDNRGHLVLTSCLSRLQRAFRVADSAEEVAQYLTRAGEKSVGLEKYAVGDIKQLTNDGVLPFTNRSYVEIRDRDTNKELKLIPLVEEDIGELHAILKDGRKQKSEKLTSHFREIKQKEARVMEGLFSLYQRLEPQLRLQPVELGKLQITSEEKQIAELNSNLHYLGHFKEGLPEGEGKEVLVEEGISYNGWFRRGQKSGPGYLVNSNLDTLYC